MNRAALNPRGNKAELRKSLKRIQAFFKQNRLKDAKPLCDKIHAQGYNSSEFLHIYGLCLRAHGDLNSALVMIHGAHEQRPNDPKILNSLGIVFQDMRDIETAIVMFKRATAADEKYYNAWENLGLALREAERYNSALLAFTCAHHLNRAKLEPLFNIALLQADMRQFERAAAILDELLSTHKDVTPGVELRRLQIAMKLEDLEYVEQHQDTINRTALNDAEQVDLDRVKAQYLEIFDRYDEAIEILKTAAARDTERRSDLIAHLGYCYGAAARLDEGISTLKALLDEQPDHNASRYNLSLLQFKRGDIADGFDNYETRWRFRAFPSKRRTFDAPQWKGEPVEGKNVLVWREQGLGDEVRYASLLPELRERGCNITFECTPKLIPLWEDTFPWATVRPEGEEMCNQLPDYAQFDYQLPLASLGTVFRRSLDDFEQNQRPWIVREHAAENKIRTQLAVAPDELLIGVCWRSMNQIASRDKIFLNCEHLGAFKDLPNVRWLNAQYSSTDEEITLMRERGLNLHHYVDLDQKNDLIGARNLLGACDLVISIGGSVGDMTGGIGTPMIYMTRELSEAYLGTDYVPWFKNCKSYPIPSFRSDETIAKIVEDWASISAWAEELKPEERKTAPAPSNTAVSLDLKYPNPLGRPA